MDVELSNVWYFDATSTAQQSCRPLPFIVTA